MPVWQRNDGLFADVEVRQDAAPAFADLDGDGKLDLVIGEYVGNFTYFKNIIPTAVKSGQSTRPSDFSLEQNFPNPFNPGTTITFTLQTAANVSLKVYDLLGRNVAVLLDAHEGAGRHEVRWDASSFAGGMYFYRLNAGSFDAVKNMVLAK
jgi:hypothetical protein